MIRRYTAPDKDRNKWGIFVSCLPHAPLLGIFSQLLVMSQHRESRNCWPCFMRKIIDRSQCPCHPRPDSKFQMFALVRGTLPSHQRVRQRESITNSSTLPCAACAGICHDTAPYIRENPIVYLLECYKSRYRCLNGCKDVCSRKVRYHCSIDQWVVLRDSLAAFVLFLYQRGTRPRRALVEL